jgi:hypothetical protein
LIEYGENDMSRLGKLIRVTQVEPREDFQVQLTFEDGTVKLIDLDPYLAGPIFNEIREDRSKFRAVKIDGGTIVWENGADIDPDVLYYDLKPAWMVETEQT